MPFTLNTGISILQSELTTVHVIWSRMSYFQDAIPMINKLRFHEQFRPAMELVFGKTLICRNLEVASQFSKSENLDCITLEGMLKYMY